MAIENQDAFAVHSEEAVSGSFTIAAKNAGKEDIMQNVYEKLISCYESIQEKIPFTPRVALVLGSGLLAPHWSIGSMRICHYQTLFLVYSIMIVFAAMFLVVVPAVFPKGEYVYDVH